MRLGRERQHDTRIARREVERWENMRDDWDVACEELLAESEVCADLLVHVKNHNGDPVRGAKEQMVRLVRVLRKEEICTVQRDNSLLGAVAGCLLRPI